MGFRINTNVAALNAQRHLSNISSKLDKSLERLSSGLRINKSADDASGMATSVFLRGQIRGLNQAARNANDAISMTQTAEGALDVTTNILLRLRELAVQAATDTTNRDLLLPEAEQLVAELTRIANDTEFVGNTLLNGSFQSGKIQVGANQGQTISFSIGDVRAAALGERATVTAALDSGLDEGGLTVGEIRINNRLVAATQETDDQVSVLDIQGTGAIADTGSLSGLVINGTAIAGVSVATAAGSGLIDEIVDAINAATGDIHVTARAASNTIVLTADSGRNITFDLSASTAPNASAIANDLGMAASYFATGTINTIYNGESSAIAKVAAIDSVKSYTDVDALVQATEVTGSAAVEAVTLAAGDLFINGIDIGAVTVQAGDADGALISAINAKSGSTGVSAALDNQNLMVLTAADGRNISLVNSAAGELAMNIADDVYRGGVKLNSAENFTVAGSTDDLGSIDTQVYSTSLDYAVSLMDLSTQVGADDALATLDAALFQVNTTRSELGAIQSRVTLTIASLTTTSENLSASDSRIRDVDFSLETAVFTKNSILTQASTAILAQANQLPQLALQLLG